MQVNRAVPHDDEHDLHELAGGFGHDFNNLLAIVTSYAALMDRELKALQEDSDDPRLTSLRADLDQIQSATGRATHLTRQLLALARQDADGPVAVSFGDADNRRSR
jgi:hypothetical protein